MILKCSLDDLMKQVRSKEFMDISTFEIIGEGLEMVRVTVRNAMVL